ncbi:MAG: hypothetical protein ABIK93_08820 [candidate division WOR-3 bacterium]
MKISRKILFGVLTFSWTVMAQGRSNLKIGFELSELLQNRFRSLGQKNCTLILGQEFPKGGWNNYGYQLLLINVELSPEHLQNNPFLKGNKSNLTGNLFVSRILVDLFPFEKKFGLVRFIPIVGLGFGYNRTILQSGQTYDLNGLTFGTDFRLQTEFLSRLFFEFPVIDASVYLWKSRPTKGTIGEIIIDYPEWELFSSG